MKRFTVLVTMLIGSFLAIEERAKAQMENRELRTRLAEAVEEINGLKEENRQLQEAEQQQTALLGEKKEKLRSQVEAMISKLNAVSD